MDIVSACRAAGISDKTYYGWRKRFGGMGRAKLTEFKALEKDNLRLKKSLSELELRKIAVSLNKPSYCWLPSGYRHQRFQLLLTIPKLSFGIYAFSIVAQHLA